MGLSKGLHAHRGALPLRSATSSIQPWEKLTHQRIRQSCNPLRKRIRSVAARSEVAGSGAEEQERLPPTPPEAQRTSQAYQDRHP